ncbi:MAG: SurA N-terminal domain-containing protein [Desulfovibrio sp.]|nr:SurA N-terminal domain-containing protein [Desulfovibrio sp.]
MLEYIRSNAQSFGVKLAFGVIILVFVFWGVGSLNEGDTVNLVATVNGEALTAREFEMAYRRAEESILRQNPGLGREQIKQELGRQVLRSLVEQTLLKQEAAKAGITVTALDLRAAVGQIKAFQDAQGKFDPATYQRVLEAQRMTPAQYENELAEDLLRQKVFDLLLSAAWTNADDVRRRYDFLREKRIVDYVFIPASRYTSDAAPDEKAVTAYYEEHKAQFAIPAKVRVACIRLAPSNLVKPETISEADARAWYEANLARFSQDEQVKAAHILVPLAEDAQEADVKKAQEATASILAELKSGKPFAEVADAHNGPNAAGPGGELGWIKRGMTVEPFEQAVFALEPGTLSEPVRTRFGLHIIKVEEKRAAGTRPFTEVGDEVRATMAQEQGADKLRDALDNLIEDNILGKSLEKSAENLGLQVETIGPASAQELIAKLGIKAEDAEALVRTPESSPMDRALEAGDAYVVARVLKATAATTQALTDAKAKIVEQLLAEKALAAAMTAAKNERTKLQDGSINPTLKTGMGIHTAAPLERNGALADFSPSAALSAAIFRAEVNQWLPEPFAVDNVKEGKGALLVHVSAVQAAPTEEWEAIKSIMTGAAQRERAEGLLGIFMQDLLSTAKVEVRNRDLVDRKGL